MRKYLFLLGLLLSAPAWASTHYIDNGSPDNTLPCTFADPCDNFSGTTLDDAGSLSTGDVVLFKAGDSWYGAEAELDYNSNGTSGSRITFGRYGTGANPKFYSAAPATYTWTSAGGGIYYTSDISTGVSDNLPFYDVDAAAGLMRTYANNDALEAGTWCRSSATTPGTSCVNFGSGAYHFIRRYDSTTPVGHQFSVGTYTHNSYNGDRGLVRTTTVSTRGDYGDFVDLDIIAPGGIGFSTSGQNTRTAGILVTGAPRDGGLAYCSTSTSEFGNYWEDYYSVFSYSSNRGVGYGQGLTTYCEGTSFTGTTSTRNGLFGIDFLDFSATTTDVTKGMCIRCTATDNGLNPQVGNYDSNLYIDGASEILIYGLRSGIAGVGSSGAGNARAGSILINSEIVPASNVPENIDILNSYGFGVHYAAYGATGGAKNIRLRFNTFSAYGTGSAEVLTYYAGQDTTAHNNEQFYNAWYGDDGSGSGVPMPFQTDIDLYYLDWNGYYRRGGSTTFFNASGSNRTLAGWQSLSSEDANSTYADPLFTTDSDTAPDFHLQAGSTYRDFIGVPATFTYQSWVPATVQADIGLYGVKGSTLASGVYDDVSVDADIGFHYDYASLTSESVTPASLTALQDTSYAIQFVMPQYITALLYNWKVKVVFPAGTVLDSGGATAVSGITGFTGGATASTASQTVTVTRDGDGYSTFPTTIGFSLSNIKNPVGGSGGAYNITITDENDVQIATADSDVSANTFIFPAPTGTGNARISGFMRANSMRLQ